MKNWKPSQRESNFKWLNFLIKSYLTFTFILALNHLFPSTTPISAVLFLGEIAYLGLSFILLLLLWIKLNLFLVKIKRKTFKGVPIKFKLHSVNLWSLVLWAMLLGSYGFQSGNFLFGDEFAWVSPSFLTAELFSYLTLAQFLLVNYLLGVAIIVFIYAIILYSQNGLKIKIVPDNWGEFDSHALIFLPNLAGNWKNSFLALVWQTTPHLGCLHPPLIILDLKLRHLKARALRQFKKETTPPLLSSFN